VGVEEPSGAKPSAWRPLKVPGNLSERIVAHIEALIDSERLQPGERLPSEREMATMLGVSRPALREAVKALEATGRVVVRHGQGVFVARSAEDVMRDRVAALELDLDQLFAMRLVLEEPAAAWAAERADEAQIAYLKEALDAEQALRQPPVDFEQLAVLDAAFHMRIVELAGNRYLLQTLEVFQELLASGMETTLAIPGRLESSEEDHRRLFRAIAAHDPERARSAVRRHVEGARAAAMARIRSGHVRRAGEVSTGGAR
jgi:GntR family transcriptional repressor for pyruvate dehydrogenase complex